MIHESFIQQKVKAHMVHDLCDKEIECSNTHCLPYHRQLHSHDIHALYIALHLVTVCG